MEERIAQLLALILMAAVWFVYGFTAFVLAAAIGACCYTLGTGELKEEATE